MNPREKVKELLPIMQAFADGKIVEGRNIDPHNAIGLSPAHTTEWHEVDNPAFLAMNYEWRIRREPREFWIRLRGSDGGSRWDSIVFTKEEAEEYSSSKLIHVREVLS